MLPSERLDFKEIERKGRWEDDGLFVVIAVLRRLEYEL